MNGSASSTTTCCDNMYFVESSLSLSLYICTSGPRAQRGGVFRGESIAFVCLYALYLRVPRISCDNRSSLLPSITALDSPVVNLPLSVNAVVCTELLIRVVKVLILERKNVPGSLRVPL